MWNNDSVTNYGNLGLSFGNILSAREPAQYYFISIYNRRHRCAATKDNAPVQKVCNNGLTVNVPHIVLLKIANTGDRPPQSVISGYFAVFSIFFWWPKAISTRTSPNEVLKDNELSRSACKVAKNMVERIALLICLLHSRDKH